MTIRSINEPDTSRTTVLTPASINEPPVLPEWAAEAPVVESIDPVEATIGDPSFDVVLSGTGFFPESVIVFAGQDEPTTFADGRLSTGVNMDVWQAPDTVKVSVRNGPIVSNEVDFTFNAAEVAPEAADEETYSDPDEMEDELEQLEEEGVVRTVHRGKPTKGRKR